MFVRKKKNRSGSISVQIIKKVNGKNRVVESIGCSKDKKQIEKLLEIANERIKELEPNLFDSAEKESKKIEFASIRNDQIVPIGDELFFGKLFDNLNLNSIFENKKDIRYKKSKLFLLKSLVISRILYPGSKLYLIDYLWYFKKEEINIQQIYRFLDTLYQDDIKDKIEKAVFNHTLSKVNKTITVTFYDVTTLYFESESEDDLRIVGFSKEGKLARPQILLGLFTTLEGYPLSYEVYEGNKYEGHTLIDILEKFQKRFNLDDKPIVVADRGMLNNANIAYLENNGYKYILAYKIKAVDEALKAEIANLTFITDGEIKTLEIEKEISYKEKDNNDKEITKKLNIKQKLILTYSSKRAKKDKKTREKAIEKIETALAKKNITKSDLKLSYYAKYLDVDERCSIKYKLNPNKVELDEKLDGIKGFATNNFNLNANDVISHYKNQYDVEKAFRISKTDLKIRPIYHRLENRIKAHILISFAAYAIYKEFEIKTKEVKEDYQISYKILRDLIKNIFAIKIDDQLIPMKLSEIQQRFYDVIISSE